MSDADSDTDEVQVRLATVAIYTIKRVCNVIL